MTLMTVERIKLFSTRSPWWCIGLATALVVGLSAVVAATSKADEMTVVISQSFYSFGMTIMMVMAVLAATTEYRFGTMKATFLAVPDRRRALLAKAAVLAVIGLVLGEVLAFGAWGISEVIRPDAPIGLATTGDWRAVAGVGVVYALASVLALGVGFLIRQSAGAITALLVYSLLVEPLINAIPKVGEPLHKLLPFVNADHFVRGSQGFHNGGDGPPIQQGMHWGPWGGLIYFAVWAIGIFALAVVTTTKRDA